MTRAELEAEAARRIDALGLAPDKRDLLHGALISALLRIHQIHGTGWL